MDYLQFVGETKGLKGAELITQIQEVILESLFWMSQQMGFDPIQIIARGKLIAFDERDRPEEQLRTSNGIILILNAGMEEMKEKKASQGWLPKEPFADIQKE